MDWLTTWGPAIVAAIVSVAMAAGFTWLFGWRNEQEHRRGVRALVMREVAHNVTEVNYLQRYVLELLRHGNADHIRRLFRETARVPKWQRVRWDLPDVGVAFSREELDKLTTWYFALGRLSSHYEWVIACARIEEFKSGGILLVKQLAAVTKTIDEVLGTMPTFPRTVAPPSQTPVPPVAVSEPDLGAGEGVGEE